MLDLLAYVLRMGFVCLLSIAMVTPLGAEPLEPPLKCKIMHGAWCILDGVDQREFTSYRNRYWRQWNLHDKYWNREVGVVLERRDCRGKAANTIEVVKVRPNTLWAGRRWNEVLLKLRKDRTCELRLFVPVDDRDFVKKAATSLSGNIAVCLRGRPFVENVLSPLVYKLLENTE